MFTTPAVLRRATGTALTLLLAVFGMVAAMSLSSSASANPYPPGSSCTVSSSDHAVHGGDTVTITGSGFPANSTVQLSVHSSPDVSLGSVKTDAHGSFTDTVTIPKSITGTDHSIVASSASTSCSFDPFASSGVAGQQAQRPTLGVGGVHASRPANTGFDAAIASAIALVLLGGGLMFVLIGRRRRSQG
jgi:hypothetical protein